MRTAPLCKGGCRPTGRLRDCKDSHILTFTIPPPPVSTCRWHVGANRSPLPLRSLLDMRHRRIATEPLGEKPYTVLRSPGEIQAPFPPRSSGLVVGFRHQRGHIAEEYCGGCACGPGCKPAGKNAQEALFVNGFLYPLR